MLKPGTGSIVDGHDYGNQGLIYRTLNMSSDRAAVLFVKDLIHSDPFLIISSKAVGRTNIVEKPPKRKTPSWAEFAR